MYLYIKAKQNILTHLLGVRDGNLVFGLRT
jgi:hypothetical protein